jgi:AraC-like DNA-binding protein
MLAWNALLVQKIDLSVPGLDVRKLQINRHCVAEVRPHAHAFGQAILYLSGEGGQRAGARTFPARSGDLFIIPAGRVHGFAPAGGARPICLVLDFVRPVKNREARITHRRLEPAALNALHALVSQLPRKGRLHLADYATVTAVVALLFEARAAPAEKQAQATSTEPTFHRVRRLLRHPESESAPLSEIARRTGYQPDYLTRKLRRESGQGLRELRNSLRFETATAALKAGATVADVAQRAGFADPAYFARWFRRRAGCTPSEFARRHR